MMVNSPKWCYVSIHIQHNIYVYIYICNIYIYMRTHTEFCPKTALQQGLSLEVAQLGEHVQPLDSVFGL